METVRFLKAKPIWPNNRRKEKNLQIGFRCDFKASKDCFYELKVCGSTLYRIFLNQEFIGYGPARAGHGYMNVDTIKLDVKKGTNKLAIEVAGYNCSSFYTLNIDSFLCAEILCDGEVMAWTGRDFRAVSLEKMRKQVVFRYSFQRAYTEVWDFTSKELYNWTVSDDLDYISAKSFYIAQKFLDRKTPLPNYDIRAAANIYESGTTEKNDFDQSYYNDRRITGVCNTFHGFLPQEIKDRPEQEMSCSFKKLCGVEKAAPRAIDSKTYIIYRLPCNTTGFIRARFKVNEKTTVYLSFSEVLRNGEIYRNGQLGNIIKLTYLPGEYSFESFEAYTLQYLCVVATEGSLTIDDVGVREYCYPVCDNIKFSSHDLSLCKIYDAAIETFRQNTLDVFMDCPSRERGGWLCDSYFTAQSEQYFAGNSIVENAFIDNFVMAEDFPVVPDGILPMCYPAEMLDKIHIPQWNMWLIVELEQFLRRTEQDKEKYKDICYNFLNYIMQFKNEDGLLENIPGWNFVEWSAANSWVQDVNYPTNMLFSLCCRIIGEIYDDRELAKYSEILRQKIIEQSFDGKFFVDNAVRENGKLIPTKNVSEACQYYAFFCGVARPDDPRFADHYNRVLCELGPDMDREKYKIEPARPFIGNYLRVELLLRWQRYDEILDQIKKFFTNMANTTGTLWEFNEDWASTCHGFASYAAVAITRALGGVKWVDNKNKVLYIDSCYSKQFNGRFDFKCGITIEVKNGERTITNNSAWSVIEE